MSDTILHIKSYQEIEIQKKMYFLPYADLNNKITGKHLFHVCSFFHLLTYVLIRKILHFLLLSKICVY